MYVKKQNDNLKILKGGIKLSRFKSKSLKSSKTRKHGQAQKENFNNKKIKEREKRIREKNKRDINNKFDIETEKLIEMTNKNRIKKEEQRIKAINIKEKKKQKRNKRIKLFLKIFIFVALIGGAIVFVLTSPIFNIKEIIVLNNSQVPSETIISLSGLKVEENIFKFHSGIVSNNIKENPYIEEVKIDRKIPNKIEITVKERTPTYSVDYMGKYIYINNQGYFLEISDDNKSLPIIYGIETNEEEIEPGKRADNNDLESLEDIIKIMDAANEKGLKDKVTSIDISDKNDYIINIEEKGKKVHLGNISNLSNKMLYVIAIMEQEEKEGEIFVNGDLNNKFQPYFREKV